MQALVFPVGPEWFAFDLAQVREVIGAQTVTALPGAPTWLAGLTNLRGELVPVVDLAALLQLPNPARTATHLVVVTTSVGTAGIATDGPPEPVDLGDPVGEGDAASALARYSIGDRVATLLDLTNLVHHVAA